MDELFPKILEWFLAKENYFRVFSDLDSRVEG